MKAKKFFDEVKSLEGVAQWIAYIIGLLGLVYVAIGVVAIFFWSLLILIEGKLKVNYPNTIFDVVINHQLQAIIIILCMSYTVIDYIKRKNRKKGKK